MIDHSRTLLLLRPKTIAIAAATSLALYAILPATAAILLLAGLLVVLVLYGVVVITGIATVIGALGSLAALSKDGGKYKGVAFGGLVLAAVCGVVCWATKDSFPPAAISGFDTLNDLGSSLLIWGFRSKVVQQWSWVPLAVSLLAAGTLLLVIGGLRCERLITYVLAKIAGRCKDCGHVNFDYRCPACGRLITDLRPSIHGIFRARCTCGRGLPTLDLVGRLNLAKVCANPECRADLDDPTLGRHGEYYLAIIGATGSGKSSLMVTSIRCLRQEFAPRHGLTTALADHNEEMTFRRWVAQLDQGQVLDKTAPREIPRAFTVAITRQDGPNSRLYLYDAAGEDFASQDDLARHTFHRFTDGVILVIDPTLEPGMRSALRDPSGGKNSSTNSRISIIVGCLINSWEERLGIRAAGPFGIPIAVVLSKVDMLDLGLQRDPSDVYDNMRAAAQSAARDSARIRRFLAEHGLDNVLAILESRFSRVAYFGVSALGRAPTGADRSPYASRGILAPLVWLAYHTRALCDDKPWLHRLHNVKHAVGGALKGREGSHGVLTPVVWLWNHGRAVGSGVVAKTILSAWRTARERLTGRQGRPSQIAAWASVFGVLLTTISVGWFESYGIARALPRIEAAYFNSGSESLDRKVYDDAIDSFKWALFITPDNTNTKNKLAEAHFGRGLNRKNGGQIQGALEDYGVAIQLRPDDPTFPGPYEALASICMELPNESDRNGDQAVKWADIYLRLTGDKSPEARKFLAKAHYQRGMEHTAKRELDAAIREFTSACEHDPSSTAAAGKLAEVKRSLAMESYTKGLSELKRGQYEIAIELFKPAITIDPSFTEAETKRAEAAGLYVAQLVDEGNKCLNRKAYDDAIGFFGKASGVHPNDRNARSKLAQAYCGRGEVWWEKKEYDRAIADLSEATKFAPEKASYFNFRGLVWLNKKNYDAALGDFTQAISLDAGNAVYLTNRGIVWNANHDYGKAIADYEAAIRTDPKLAVAYNNLGWLRATCTDGRFRDGNKALQSATTACELTDWKNAGYIDTLAAAFAVNGRIDDAVNRQEHALRVLQANPGPDEIRSELIGRLNLYKLKKDRLGILDEQLAKIDARMSLDQSIADEARRRSNEFDRRRTDFLAFPDPQILLAARRFGGQQGRPGMGDESPSERGIYTSALQTATEYVANLKQLRAQNRAEREAELRNLAEAGEAGPLAQLARLNIEAFQGRGPVQNGTQQVNGTSDLNQWVQLANNQIHLLDNAIAAGGPTAPRNKLIRQRAESEKRALEFFLWIDSRCEEYLTGRRVKPPEAPTLRPTSHIQFDSPPGVVLPQAEDRYAANLGVYYRLVPFGRAFGATITRAPGLSSPLRRLQLTPGDTIVALDGLPFREAVDIDLHYTWTQISFVRMNQNGTFTEKVDLGPRNLVDYHVASLGICYVLFPYGNGYGARLTRYPSPGSPCAGLRLEPGDMIVSLDGQPFRSHQDIAAHVNITDISYINVRDGELVSNRITLPARTTASVIAPNAK